MTKLPPDEVEALMEIARRDGVLVREHAVPLDITEDGTMVVTPVIQQDVN